MRTAAMEQASRHPTDCGVRPVAGSGRGRRRGRHPFLGVLTYLTIHNDGMTSRRLDETRVTQAQDHDDARTTAAGAPPAPEREKAKGLLDRGTITVAEFDSINARALA